MSLPPLYGLLLAGGKSSRMKTAKGALLHHENVTFQEHALTLLGASTSKAYLNLAHPKQSGTHSDCAEISTLPTIIDIMPEQGPLGGLEAAFEESSQHAWLVVACDLPNLNIEALQGLIGARSLDYDVTCYQNAQDGVPEPLLAIYEPSALPALQAALKSKRYCARHVLETLRTRALQSPFPTLHQNLNYPEDYTEWQLSRCLSSQEKTVRVEYYAKLKQEAGCASEERKTQSITLAGLWEQCRLSHRLRLTLPSVKPAVNNTFAPWDYQIQDGDLIAFMPPFAGG